MNSYFTTLTVKALREIAKQAGIKGYSRMVKADLVGILTALVNHDHFTAVEMNAVIDEAYGFQAENVGMTLPQFMAHKSAHRKAGQIKASGFWNCCVDNPTHVVVWEDGAKQAVCKGTASYYTGEVEELPTGHKEKCADCGESFWVESESVADVAADLIETLTEIKAIFDSGPIGGTISQEEIEKAHAEAHTENVLRDSIKITQDAIAYWTPIESRAWRAFQNAQDAVAKDVAHMVWQDASNTLGTLNRTMAWLSDPESL